MILNFDLPSRKFKNEAEFTTWFGGQITKRGGFFHKISDYSLGFKPFDAIFALGGLVGAIEFKSTPSMSCYPYTMLRGSSIKKPGTQVKSLLDYGNNGGLSLVVVYSTRNHRYQVLEFKDLSLDTKIIL